MITKLELEKNVLDLSYRRNLQLLNTVLILGIGFIFTYIGALVLNSDKLVIYTFLLILVGSVTILLYKKINENLREISKRIKEII